MHASSYIRYLKMSKSCKTDTRSYSAAGFPCSSDRRKEKLNRVPNFPGASLIVSLFIEHVRHAETQDYENNPVHFTFDEKATARGALWVKR